MIEEPAPRTPRLLAAVVTVIVAVIVTVAATAACTVARTGSAHAPPSDPPAAPVTYDEPTAGFAAEFARVRTLDLCALHDVERAERITGAERESLRLTTGIDTCQLELGTTRPNTSWGVELGFAPRSTTDWTAMELAGTRVLKRPGDTACDYVVPSVDPVGLTVHATYARAAGASGPDDTRVCRTVERYLAEAVLPRWADPPTLAAGLTAPRVPLLGKDPCAALAAGVAGVPDDRGRGTAMRMTDPYSCDGARGSAIAAYTVRFAVFSEILDLRGEPVGIGGFTAFPAGAVGAGGCSFQIVVRPDFVFSATEGTVYHGGIVIGLPSCDDTTVAERVVDDLVAQPDAPAPTPGAQLIGDLAGTG